MLIISTPRSGKFLDGSVTHTNDEQGAWWQVDLGGKKKINQSLSTLYCIFFI
jgi:hypothetical protein